MMLWYAEKWASWIHRSLPHWNSVLGTPPAWHSDRQGKWSWMCCIFPFLWDGEPHKSGTTQTLQLGDMVGVLSSCKSLGSEKSQLAIWVRIIITCCDLMKISLIQFQPAKTYLKPHANCWENPIWAYLNWSKCSQIYLNCIILVSTVQKWTLPSLSKSDPI